MEEAVLKAIEDGNNATRWQSKLMIDLSEANDAPVKVDVLGVVGLSKGSVLWYPDKEPVQKCLSLRESAKHADFSYRFGSLGGGSIRAHSSKYRPTEQSSTAGRLAMQHKNDEASNLALVSAVCREDDRDDVEEMEEGDEKIDPTRPSGFAPTAMDPRLFYKQGIQTQKGKKKGAILLQAGNNATRSQSRLLTNLRVFHIVALIYTAIVFTVGMLIGSSVSMSVGAGVAASAAPRLGALNTPAEAAVGESTVLISFPESHVQERIRVAVRQFENQAAAAALAPAASKDRDDVERTTQPRFPREAHGFIVGMARMNRSEFAEKFNALGLGVPFRKNSDDNSEAIVLYGDESALPRNRTVADNAAWLTHASPHLPVDEAMANCGVVSVALVTLNKDLRHCLAVVGETEAYHLHRFMRSVVPKTHRFGKSPLDPKAPLRLVGRLHSADSGIHEAAPPPMEISKDYHKLIGRYLGDLDDALKKLSPIASAAAINNTIVLMTCNFGQSDLLINFVCGARSRNVDLSSVVVFPSDEETLAVARGLGLHAFYDDSMFDFIPKEAAVDFGDKVFGQAVLAKVMCSHMASQLGYDILLQDVDVSWYRNPLEYFLDPSLDGFDLMVQDDGSMQHGYRPKRSNAGFYFARNNVVTRSFFQAYVMAGDLILGARNDQGVFNSLLNEYASLYGLRMLTLDRHGDGFPSGSVFHNQPGYVKAMINGTVRPYVFHMSWTLNKKVKVQYLQQMGDWFVKGACLENNLTTSETAEAASLIQACCLPEPDIRCHYRDKPSIIPCKDSPASE